MKDALLVVLTSPQFLFLIENSKTPGAGAARQLRTGFEAFVLPVERPAGSQDAAAGRERARCASNWMPKWTRMIADPRFSRFASEFTSQWLSLDKFQVLEPDRKRFPKLTRDTRAQLKQEPVEFVQYLIRNNLPVRNLIQSDFVVANEAVASYYDLADKTESGFQFVAIQHGRPELGGVLTQAAIMAGFRTGANRTR